MDHGGTTTMMTAVTTDGETIIDSEEEASLMLTMFENDIIEGYRPPGISHSNNNIVINVVNQRIVSRHNDRSKDGGDGCGDDGDDDYKSFDNHTTFLAESADNTAGQRRPRRRRPREEVVWVQNPGDEGGSFLLRDRHGDPGSVGRLLLATIPLNNDELSSRRRTGPTKGERKDPTCDMAGSTVSTSLNYVFGRGEEGWTLEIKDVQQAGKGFDDKKRTFEVVYTAHVRLVHRLSGTYREEVGCCESMDGSYATAVGNAIKGSITDALKRSARHFGDKFGGGTLHNNNNNGNRNMTKKNAPTTLQDALDMYDIEHANSKFGCLPYDPNKKAKGQQTNTDTSSDTDLKQKMDDLDPEYGNPGGSINTKQSLSDNNHKLPQQQWQAKHHVGQTLAFPSDSVSTSTMVAQQQRPQQKLQFRSYLQSVQAAQVSPHPSKLSRHLNTMTPVKQAYPILTSHHTGQFQSPTFMSPSHDPSSMQKISDQNGLVVTPSSSLSSSDHALNKGRGRNPSGDVQGIGST